MIYSQKTQEFLKQFDPSKSQVIRNITREEYDAIGALNNSGIQKFDFCPTAYKFHYIDKVRIEPSDAMKRGIATDALIFSGPDSEEFTSLKTKTEKTDKKTGEITVTIKNNTFIEKAFLCEKEIRRSPLFPKEVDKNNAQVCLYVNFYGVPFKGLVDYLEPNSIDDLKCPTSIENFKPDFYLTQLAFYSWLYKEITDEVLGGKLFVVDSGNAERQKARFWNVNPMTLKSYYPDANKINSWVNIWNNIQQGNYGIWKTDPDYTPPVFDDKCLSCDYFNYCPFAVQKKPYEL